MAVVRRRSFASHRISNHRRITLNEQPKTEKQWTKPELLVLVRSKPEEAVLSACKQSSGGSNQHATTNSCSFEDNGCFGCEGMVGS
jgi:hypothetical protein